MKKIFVILIATLFLFSMFAMDLGALDKKCSTPKKVEKKCCADKVKKGEKPCCSKATLTCPVMGHAIKDKSKAVKFEYKGKTLYFCCQDCVAKFKADPEKYTKKCKEGITKDGCKDKKKKEKK